MPMSGDMDSTFEALSYPEVLVCIVKYLRARDVTSFRRVCKLWNEYCDPKFVFRRFDLQPQEIDALICMTNCRRLNLEFQDCDLKSISDEMWKTWNPKLRSLCLYGCITKIETLKSIISNCIRLENLEIVLKRYIESYLLEELLDYFIERKERHTRLQTLSINGQIFMTMSHFLKILTVFPCIVSLSCNVGRADGDGRYICGESYGTYDLRKLRKNHGLCSERPVAPMLDYQLFRLTTYKTILNFGYIFQDISRKEQLFQFFTVQKDLEVIDLRIYRISDETVPKPRPMLSSFEYSGLKLETAMAVPIFPTDLLYLGLLASMKVQRNWVATFVEAVSCKTSRVYPCNLNNDTFGESIKSLIFHVLKTCSNLREFCLRDNHSQHPLETAKFGFIKFTSKEFKEFFSLISNLQSFKLTYLLKRDTSKTTVLSLSHPNTSLNVLRLNTKEPYFFSIVKLSSQLKHLNIDVYSDQQLREIIVAMPNLEILILRLRGCTNYGFAGKNEESSIRRLQKLEYLHILDCKGKITKKVFNEFRFPRLKYLGLKLKHGNQLPETFLNMPAINTLAVCVVDRNFYWMPEVITKLCKCLRNLEHLIADDMNFDRRMSDEKKLRVFNSLSNLRFITCCMEQKTFIIDRLSGKANSGDMYKLKFCGEEFYDRWNCDYDC